MSAPTSIGRRSPRFTVLTGAAAALIAGSLLVGLGPAVAQEGATPTLASCPASTTNLSVADVAEKVNPAVVTITNLQQAPADLPAEIGGALPGQPGQGAIVPFGTGSGFIVDEAGDVVTNAHVVNGASRLTVAFQDGSEVGAKLVGADELLDIAVIKLDLPAGAKVPGVACFGDSDALRVGDPVVAIGSALGELTNTVTEGIVNAKDRSLDGGYGLSKLIQHDAKIWRGNSGGPLLNLRGEVVGVNAAGISDQMMGTSPADIAFAIDGNTVRDTARSLIADGTVDRPFLGIQGQALPLGHQVDAVVPDSGAAAAGLRPGDIIVAVDGEAIDRGTTLLDVLLKRQVGDTIQVTIDRDGAQQTLPVTLGKRPAETS